MVRDIRSEDIETIHRINRANTPEVGDVSVERLSWLVDESDLALAIDVDEELAGFCLVLGPGSAYDSVNYRWFAERFPTAMYLDRIAIDSAFRRQGLASRLYDHVERAVAATPARSLALEVNVEPPNPGSLAFHERRGYAEVGRQTTPYGATVSLRLKRCASC